MKFFRTKSTTVGIELSESGLESTRGAQQAPAEKNPYLTTVPYSQARADAIAAKDRAVSDGWNAMFRFDIPGIVIATKDHAAALKEQDWAEENLNALLRERNEAFDEAKREEEWADLRRAEIERARVEALREQDQQEKKEREEEERKRLLGGDKEATKEEVEDFINHAPSSGGSSGGGGAPANEQPYAGESPSFPTNVLNVPAPHTPQIVYDVPSPPPSGEVGRLY